jgi:hypothetical protein
MSDVLGGNAKAQMIVTVSPSDFSETHNSLLYASKVKKVCNRQTKNVETAQIKELKSQLKKLQQTGAGAAV